MPENTGDSLAHVLMEEVEDSPVRPPGWRRLDWLRHSQGQKPLVVNPDLLASTSCTCYTKGDKKACFSEAAIGPLDQDTLAQCRGTIEQAMDQEMEELLNAASRCKVESRDYLEWSACTERG